jgi:hypothetical protein
MMSLYERQKSPLGAGAMPAPSVGSSLYQLDFGLIGLAPGRPVELTP